MMLLDFAFWTFLHISADCGNWVNGIAFHLCESVTGREFYSLYRKNMSHKIYACFILVLRVNFENLNVRNLYFFLWNLNKVKMKLLLWYNYLPMARSHNVVSQLTATSSASCRLSSLPSNLVSGQELTICDSVWHWQAVLFSRAYGVSMTGSPSLPTVEL